jgi:hypothetical protein
VLYACDRKWWDLHDGLPAFDGLKITQDGAAAKRYGLLQVRNTKRDQLALGEPGLTGWGGNSGFQALNLAVQFGARKIVLVGFDMTLEHGVHWHGLHPRGLNNPAQRNVEKWRAALDGAHGLLAQLGVLVLNASPVSTLTKYRKVTLEEAMECCD